MSNVVILKNKKATFEYSLIEEISVGLLLDGWMVKSIRAGKVSSADGSYVRFHNGEAFLDGLYIKPLENMDKFSSSLADSVKKRQVDGSQVTIKLLLKKSQIERLQEASKDKGYTVIFKDLYWQMNGGRRYLVKATIALAKGKKLHDKRQAVKERDMGRDARREMKGEYS